MVADNLNNYFNSQNLMNKKSFSIAKMIGCCGCFGFTKKHKRALRPAPGFSRLSEDFLLGEDVDDEESCSSHDDMTSTTHEEETDTHSRVKNSEEILQHRTQNGLICRQFPVKETNKVFRSEVNVVINISFDYVKFKLNFVQLLKLFNLNVFNRYSKNYCTIRLRKNFPFWTVLFYTATDIFFIS